MELPLILVNDEKSSNPNDMPFYIKRRIFILFIYICIAINFDSGVIPVSLVQMEKDLSVNNTELAALGSLPYFGLSLASIFCSWVFMKFDARNVLAVNLFINALLCAVFAIAYDKALIFISRFLNGFTQAFLCVYTPVWVNAFSPPDRQATWIGIIQGFSPLGK